LCSFVLLYLSCRFDTATMPKVGFHHHYSDIGHKDLLGYMAFLVTLQKILLCLIFPKSTISFL
ncbi:hypothetical protein, partial [uncultured Duncaniella sp.]|uniref:hypothetical protein n=1 Tax=uncultured Duncaniella sp. TaxID=2768039 RepID=UPI002608C143